MDDPLMILNGCCRPSLVQKRPFHRGLGVDGCGVEHGHWAVFGANQEHDRAKKVQPSALWGFVVTPGFILAVALIFRNWTSNARNDWDELDQAAFQIRSALGISLQAWGQARIMLGQEEVITALAAICARHAAGKVRSPGGLLRRMVELHQTGELRLDWTLLGLADKVRKGASAAGVGRPGQA